MINNCQYIFNSYVMITSDTSRSNLSSKVKLNILLTNVVSSNPAQARCIRYNIMW